MTCARLPLAGLAMGLAVGVLAVVPDASQAADQLWRTPFPGGFLRSDGLGCNTRLIGGGDLPYRIAFVDGRVVLQKLDLLQQFAAPLETGMLPDGEIITGPGYLRRAWLSDPTDRYDHGVLGDRLEAGAVVAMTADRRELVFSLDGGSVFEDRFPRLVDITGDGRREILLVRSYLDRGAALIVLGAIDNRLQVLAETPPIGKAHRWLNPAGVADFDGDGRPEIAYIVTPHIGGVLKIIEWTADGWRTEFSRRGYANHVLGSRALRLSAVMDYDGDGVEDLVVPTQDRRRLEVLRFDGETYQTRARVDLGSELVSDIAVCDLDENGRVDLVFVLADDQVAVLLR